MEVLGNDEELLVWGADRPFQIQLIAAFDRLGNRALGLVENEDGKKKLDQFHPKNSLGLDIPSHFSGTLIWAPPSELFSNTPLSSDSLNEISKIKSAISDQKIKCLWLIPHSAQDQVDLSTPRHMTLLMPALVGFGDAHVFDTLLEDNLGTNFLKHEITGEYLSIFDAVSFCLSMVRAPNTPSIIWAPGHSLKEEDLLHSLEELTQDKTFKKWIQKMSPIKKKFSQKTVPQTTNSTNALEVFPTTLTPWQRFLRDSFRIYNSTADSRVLLHFRPTKTP